MELYQNHSDTALRYADGDQQKADYILDCSVYEYYYRLRNLHKFNKWKADQMKL